MDALEEAKISCPYCGEPIHILLNPEDIGQAYVEDCQVCCKPIEMTVYWADGELGVTARSDNE
tara:strand:- start:613 stop:801 length:189 start_codon:yes stop_codon:yes gene_type:complete